MNLSAKQWLCGRIFVKMCFFNHPKMYRSRLLKNVHVYGISHISKYYGTHSRWSMICCHFPKVNYVKENGLNLSYRWHSSSSSSGSGSKQEKQSEVASHSEDKSKDQNVQDIKDESFENLGLVARFKKMYKEYWYVLVPVHLATSAVWFGTFYYASKSGMDIVALMESWNFNETLIKPFRNSSLGHVAVAYLLYKIATPARYTVTLGATTVSIKQLVKHGYIKPVPSRAELVQMYQDRKDNIQTIVADKKTELIEKKQQIISDIQHFSEEFTDSMKAAGPASNPQPPSLEEPHKSDKQGSHLNPNENKEKVTNKSNKIKEK